MSYRGILLLYTVGILCHVSGALNHYGYLLSYPAILLASYTTIILIFTLFSTYIFIIYLTCRSWELATGRIAMVAIAGFVAQELVDQRTIWEHWSMYGLGPGSPR